MTRKGQLGAAMEAAVLHHSHRTQIRPVDHALVSERLRVHAGPLVSDRMLEASVLKLLAKQDAGHSLDAGGESLWASLAEFGLLAMTFEEKEGGPGTGVFDPHARQFAS